jgi:predicted GTPase
VVVDPLRPGHELGYHPGETNVRMADIIVINKEDSASLEAIEEVKRNIGLVNPAATVIDAVSEISVEDGELIRGRRVLVVEDGPTLTHGGMSYGAGYVAARKWGAAEVVSPYPYATGSIKETYDRYGQTREVLPAMGYSPEQIEELQETIERAACELVVIGTPIDLRRVMPLKVPAVRVKYELVELGKPNLMEAIGAFLEARAPAEHMAAGRA